MRPESVLDRAWNSARIRQRAQLGIEVTQQNDGAQFLFTVARTSA